jgi:hypothetical protein
MVVEIRIAVPWDVIPCSFVHNRRYQSFRVACRFRLQRHDREKNFPETLVPI